MKILFLCPYFGKLPEHFHYFLKSCEYNNTINWLIYTDDERYNDVAPRNVIIKNVDFRFIKNRVQNNFDFKISLENPYKLCDFRPAYGDIFNAEIKGYDFWGHCDFDVIFGDIRKFITDDLLENYCKIFPHGCLSIYKNDYKINNAYKYCHINEKHDINISYRDIFSSKDFWGFDEMNGLFDIHKIFKILNFTFYDSSEHLAEIDWRAKRFLLICDNGFVENRVLEWINGKLIDKSIVDGKLTCREYALCHFSSRSFSFNTEKNAPMQSFIITPNAILTKYLPLNVDNIIEYSKINGICEIKQYTKEDDLATLKESLERYMRLKGK